MLQPLLAASGWSNRSSPKAITYLDHEIESLIGERKVLPHDWQSRTRLKPKRGHYERHLDVSGASAGQFRPILRKSVENPLDFSIILAVRVPQSNRLFRLRRYNGKSHEHTNHIERVTFYDFHIHFATERYQEIGAREDTFAEPTDRYSDVAGALACLIADANFDTPPDSQRALF